MRVLGIDPGLGITGYGVVDSKNGSILLKEAGVIRTSQKKKIQDRLCTIASQIQDIIDEHKPDVCVLEELYSHYKHPTTSILMAHARGVVCLVCSQKNTQLVGYPVKRIRKAILGNGNASKEQVQRMVQNIFCLKQAPQPIDITDALALAIGHIQMSRGKMI